MKNTRKRNIYEAKSNATLLLIAIICAIAAWFIVAMTLYPSESKVIVDIPIKFDISGTSAAENGLSITSKSAEKVTINFDCSRTDYNRINAEDINAHVDFENITTEGSKTLTVKVESLNGAELSNLKVYPSTVEVELYKFEIKTVNVKPKVNNITVAEGKIFGDIKCQPEEITLTGPSVKLASIAECYAVSDKSLTPLETNYSGLISDRYEFVDADGNVINSDLITADPSAVNISIPVLTQKTVPFKVVIPSTSDPNFDRDSLDFTITPAELTIASGSSDVTLTDEPLQIKIALNTIDIGFSKNYSVENILSGKNVENISGIETVNVTLNDDGLASREITLSGANVDLRHVPSDGYKYSIVTEKFNVKLIGPADVINEITAADLDAEVNFFGEDTSKNPDLFSYNVMVSCKSHNNVWCVDTPSVNIGKTPKENTARQSAPSPSVSSGSN